MTAFDRWKNLPGLPTAAVESLTRYPVLADRAMHEIERIYDGDFAKLVLKKQIKQYQSSPWYASIPFMQQQLATMIATAYCGQQKLLAQRSPAVAKS